VVYTALARPARVQSSQLEPRGTVRVLLSGGVSPYHYLRGALAADDAKPQRIFVAFMWRNLGEVGGFSNLHEHVLGAKLEFFFSRS
jgi:hypothetical protein